MLEILLFHVKLPLLQSEDAKICYKYVTAEARQDSPPKVVDYRTSSPYHVDKEAWSDQKG